MSNGSVGVGDAKANHHSRRRDRHHGRGAGRFPSADILIEDGAIVAVGPSLEAGDAERIDGAGMIALPGIIDAHTCLWQTVLRGYVPDLWTGTYNTNCCRSGAATRPRTISTRPMSAPSRCCPTAPPRSSTIATTSAAPTTRRFDRGAEDDRHPASLHLFLHDLRAGQFPDGRRGSRMRAASTTSSTTRRPHHIGFGIDSIGAPDSRAAAFSRALKAPSCIHVNETGTIDRLHAAGLLGPDFW